MKEIRLLRANEIECRVSAISEKGISLLLYKDARVDQKILDETFTPFGWKRSHQSIDGNLYCIVEIYDEDKKEWVSKQDVGVTSYSEKEKGQASDSFKRACFNWGIGRELYSAPFIWIPANKVNIQPKGDKYIIHDRFAVQYITYNEQREIDSLVIVNESGNLVYKKRGKVANLPVQPLLSDQQKKELEAELERTGVTLETVLKRYKLETLEQMTEEIYEKAMKSLKRSKEKQAA